MSRSPGPRLLIHWPRFGPYHRARLRAAVRYFGGRGIRASGLEIASSDTTYAWHEVHTRDQLIHTLFPGQQYEEINLISLWRSIDSFLKQVKPTAIAINGYSSKSALMLLAWSKLHRCRAILMSESKADDFPRHFWREEAKGFLIRSYDAYLCGGSLHHEYLEKLGAQRDRIFLGYDAVDNEYFWKHAEQARRNPEMSSHLPGLSDHRPFFLASSRFIPRKNLLGLLEAYKLYLQRMAAGVSSPWRLVILGDGPQRGQLESYIRKNDLQSWASLPGFRQIEELPAYYASAKAFIHPALQEQWGLVVNEAMASGLPVIVSERCGCVPELIRQGVNGSVFDPGNHLQLADLMCECSSSGKFTLGEAGNRSQQIIGDWGVVRFASGLYATFLQAVFG